MSINDVFAGALRHYRQLASMSQEDLANAARLDRTYISQLERARKSPTLTTLEKLAGCLGVALNGCCAGRSVRVPAYVPTTRFGTNPMSPSCGARGRSAARLAPLQRIC